VFDVIFQKLIGRDFIIIGSKLERKEGEIEIRVKIKKENYR